MGTLYLLKVQFPRILSAMFWLAHDCVYSPEQGRCYFFMKGYNRQVLGILHHGFFVYLGFFLFCFYQGQRKIKCILDLSNFKMQHWLSNYYSEI